MKHTFKTFAVLILWGAGIPALLSLAVLLLWNATLPAICGFATLSFWQALGIFLLGQLLSAGFVAGIFLLGAFVHGARHHSHKDLHNHWHSMSREERHRIMRDFLHRHSTDNQTAE